MMLPLAWRSGPWRLALLLGEGVGLEDAVFGAVVVGVVLAAAVAGSVVAEGRS